MEENGALSSQHGYSASVEPYKAGYDRISGLSVPPIELESPKTASSHYSTEEFEPSGKPAQRSTSIPIASAFKSEPRAVLSLGYEQKEFSVWSANSQNNHLQSLKQSHEKPSRAPSPNPKKTARHALLEPLVAKHRREAMCEISPHTETEQAGEMGVFGMMEGCLDGQAGEALSTPNITFHAYLPHSQEVGLRETSEPTRSGSVEKRTPRWPIPGLEVLEPRPAVPKRSSERLARFPLYEKSCSSPAVDYASRAQNQHAPHQRSRTHDYNQQGPSMQTQRRVELGKAGRSASSSTQVGRLAPPILSHAALTASANLGLNDLSSYLKNTGPPSPAPQPLTRHRQKRSLKLFRSRDRRKQTEDDAQSASASLQRIHKQASAVPSCAREMHTTAGSRHLRIVVPAADSVYEMQAWERQAEQRRKHEGISIQRSYHGEKIQASYPNTLVGGPVWDPNSVRDTLVNGDYNEGFDEKELAYTAEQVKERLAVLQQQNLRLMEELAKILGLNMEEHNLEYEDVLRASAKARFVMGCE
ncbi:hypothetical protein yc1106_08373 [Curvularia clavata]|uniref:Uncharacterized protein n=1 Tax=Curvularia clavata TaxID=95742 RepID=A0A9Q9DWN8_CURCL|nr:hypothetical protein yc1106_08373 [Curvularia clavata]